MKRINQFIIIFIVFTVASFYGAWWLIHSEYVASKLSNHLKSAVLTNKDLNITFKKIEVSLFPPSTTLKGTEVTYKYFLNETNNEIKYGGDVRVSFDILYLLQNRLQVSELSLQAGELDLGKMRNVKNEKLNFDKLKKSFTQFLEQLEVKKLTQEIPLEVKKINFLDVRIQSDVAGLFVNKLDIEKQKKQIVIDLNSSAVNLTVEGSNDSKLESLKFQGEVLDKEIKVKDLSLESGDTSIALHGYIKSTTSGIKHQVETIFNGDISTVANFYPVKELMKIQGRSELKLKFEGSFENYDAEVMGRLSDFKSEYFQAKTVDFFLAKNGEYLSMEKLSIQDGKELLDLDNPTQIYNFKKEEVVLREIVVTAKHLKTNRALYYLNSTLAPLKGEINGKVRIVYDSSTLKFHTVNEVQLDNFELRFSEKSPSILSNKKIKISRGNFDVNLTTFETDIDVEVSAGNLKIASVGKVTREGVVFVSKDALIDLKELGPISTVPLDGVGKGSFVISGKYEDVNLAFDMLLDRFSVLDFNVDQTKTKVDLSLKNMRLKIADTVAKVGSGKIEADGFIDFNKDTELGLKFIATEVPLERGWRALRPVTKDLPFYHQLGNIKVTSTFAVVGPATTIGVTGKLNANKLELANEDIDSLSLDYIFGENKLEVSNVMLREGDARFKGWLKYDVTKDYLHFSGILERLRMKSLNFFQIINLGIDGFLDGRIEGEGFLKRISTVAELRLKDSRAGDIPVMDSYLKISHQLNDWFFKFSGIGGQIDASGRVDLNKEITEKNSEIEIYTDILDMRVPFAILSGHNASNETIQGFMKANVYAVFNVNRWYRGDYQVDVRNFFIRGKDLTTSIVDQPKVVSIVDGVIKKWEIKLETSKDYFRSFAEGDLAKSFKIENSFLARASTLELLSDKLSSLSGTIFGKLNLIGGGEKTPYWYSEVMGNDLYGRYSKIPGSFEKVNLNAIVENGKIIIRRLSGIFGKGEFSTTGKVDIIFPFPSVDIDTKFENTHLSLFNKSDFILSGRTKLKGTQVPYNLTGDISIVKSYINDEITEFKGDEGEAVKYGRFIPKRETGEAVSTLLLDLDINILSPIEIKNSLLELYFGGQAHISGPIQSPRARGELSIDQTKKSKITFKGQEFILSEGKISFEENAPKIDPVVKFLGDSKIKGYLVTLGVSGKSDKLEMSLKSEPTLPKEDILSLITLGVTSDMTRKLGDNDRQSVTSIGLGSLLADQFKINQGLNSFLGLKLSVAPEVGSASESSLLQGRSVGGDANSSRLTSSTKVKLEKKISEKMDLSVSSIVGGGLEQKQEMNLDYDLGKNIQLQGVYEMKPTEESKNPNSVGADIKFRIPFK